VPYVAPYAEQMQADLRLTGLIVGAYGFVQMVIRFPLGIFSDRIGKRKIFILMGLLFAGISGLVVYFFP
jgi:MFS family permease